MLDKINKCSHKFVNGVTLVNTTPHDIRFKDTVTEEIVTIPSDRSVVLNASVSEERMDKYRVTARFNPSTEGEELLNDIEKFFENEADPVFIIGSVLAAQAYKGRVCAMTPVPGFERVAPAEKLMSDSKFTIY